MFFITAGYHRYFAHRSFRLGRVAQFGFALGGLTAAQKGPLWWAGNHRDHHRFADTENDPHSPQQGFWWSHIGWILSGQFNEKKYDRIPDFAKYPELRFLDKHDWIGPWALAVACYLIAGWSGLVIGFFASTVALWHTTFMVNSVAHVFGRRRYGSDDTSRNSFLVAVFTMGEGWHNNHHHYPASARQGFFWWEFDPTYYLLRALSFVGVVRDLRRPPQAVKGSARIRFGHLDLGMLRLHLNRAAKTARDDALVVPLRDLAARAEALAKQARQSERASA
ncbi:MAG: fatty acid desaturase [Actinobacteria bacterium]|nr:fatty acid desaturase [Actinomycetota bacterium]